MERAAAGFSPEELEAARDEYLREQERDHPSPKVRACGRLARGAEAWGSLQRLSLSLYSRQVKLRYAIALAKSRKRDDKHRGIGLLEGAPLAGGLADESEELTAW